MYYFIKAFAHILSWCKIDTEVNKNYTPENNLIYLPLPTQFMRGPAFNNILR